LPPRRQWASIMSRVSEPRRVPLRHREPDDLARATAPHLRDQRVVGVEHAWPVAGDRLDQHRLDVGELLDGVDAAQAEVVGLHVEHDGDVVALVAEALAQDAAAGDLEDREVDARVLQHHPRAARARTRRPGSAAARRSRRRRWRSCRPCGPCP
jgi:hypothetical protein